jgi:isoquinoline 1-oxidoreductase subunit alpha
MVLPSFFLRSLQSDFTLFGRIRRATFFLPLPAPIRKDELHFAQSKRKVLHDLSPGGKQGDKRMDAIAITVNGKQQSVEVTPDTPLLWVLRDTLGLTGTKFGCGQALCGACTVHVDGDPIRSCTTRISAVAGRKITTIEGLSPDGHHPVQVAWLENQVPQCGYCQVGMIMTTSALLAKNSAPTDADIDDALGGHICRCGTYQRIRHAVHQAASKKSSNMAPDEVAKKPALQGAR